MFLGKQRVVGNKVIRELAMYKLLAVARVCKRNAIFKVREFKRLKGFLFV